MSDEACCKRADRVPVGMSTQPDDVRPTAESDGIGEVLGPARGHPGGPGAGEPEIRGRRLIDPADQYRGRRKCVEERIEDRPPAEIVVHRRTVPLSATMTSVHDAPHCVTQPKSESLHLPSAAWRLSLIHISEPTR